MLFKATSSIYLSLTSYPWNEVTSIGSFNIWEVVKATSSNGRRIAFNTSATQSSMRKYMSPLIYYLSYIALVERLRSWWFIIKMRSHSSFIETWVPVSSETKNCELNSCLLHCLPLISVPSQWVLYFKSISVKTFSQPGSQMSQIPLPSAKRTQALHI